MSTPEDTSPVPEFPTQADLEAFVKSIGVDPATASLPQIYSALKSEVAAGNIPPGYRPKDTSSAETSGAPAEAEANTSAESPSVPSSGSTEAPKAEASSTTTPSGTEPSPASSPSGSTPPTPAATAPPAYNFHEPGTVVGSFRVDGVQYNVVVA